MTSVIFTSAARYLMPLLLLFSVFLLMRGHNEPGGGFVGGLTASAAFILYALAHGVSEARTMLRTDPRHLTGFGLLLSLLSGCAATAMSRPFLTGLWAAVDMPVLGKVGSPQFFDIGVYFVVIGVTLTIVFTLSET